jgi:2-iminobutanoate/2-iminopropanoate deaminase
VAHDYFGGSGELPLTPAVVVDGKFCFVSGQVGIDKETGRLRSGSVADEAEAALGNVLAALEAAGFGAADLASVTVLLTDLGAYQEFNEVYARLLGGPPWPARMAYEVSALPLGARVEIGAVAVQSEP